MQPSKPDSNKTPEELEKERYALNVANTASSIIARARAGLANSNGHIKPAN